MNSEPTGIKSNEPQEFAVFLAEDESVFVLSSSPDFLFGTAVITTQEIVLACALLFVLAGMIFANAQRKKLKSNFKFLVSIDLEDELKKSQKITPIMLDVMEHRIAQLKKEWIFRATDVKLITTKLLCLKA